MAEQIDAAARRMHRDPLMKRMSWVACGGALLALVIGCRSSGGNEAVSATNTTSAELPAPPPATTPPVPFAGNPASVATFVDGEPQPAVTQTTSSTTLPQGASIDPHGQPLVTPSLVSPTLVEPGLDNAGTSSPPYSPTPSSRMSTPLPSSY